MAFILRLLQSCNPSLLQFRYLRYTVGVTDIPGLRR
jgi:hypothetical protein